MKKALIAEAIDIEINATLPEIELQQFEVTRLRLQRKTQQYRAYLRKKIREEFGTKEQWTNLKKVALNAATASLCDMFRQMTGSPHHGLVGQILVISGLDTSHEHDTYEVLRKRVKNRERAVNKSVP